MFREVFWSLMGAMLVGLATQSASAQGEKLDQGPSKQMVASSMKLTLKNKLVLEGSPVEVEAIKMNSLFGEATIPLHTIAGIRFAQSANEQTTVVLLNGDALTGEINLSDVKFVSEWGEAKVNVGYIISIVFRPDLQWSSVKTPNGTRFRLTTSQPGTTSQSYPTTSSPRRNFRPN